MEEIKVDASLVEKISQNTQKPYKCIEIRLTPTYVKTVFLERAEQELLALNDKKEDSYSPFV